MRGDKKTVCVNYVCVRGRLEVVPFDVCPLQDTNTAHCLSVDSLFLPCSPYLAVCCAVLYCRRPSLKHTQGVARSMPTGAALDRVAKALNLPFFETPTGNTTGAA